MYKIKITVNGEAVRLTDFPSKIISNAIMAMIETLQDVETIENAVIEISKEEK